MPSPVRGGARVFPRRAPSAWQRLVDLVLGLPVGPEGFDRRHADALTAVLARAPGLPLAQLEPHMGAVARHVRLPRHRAARQVAPTLHVSLRGRGEGACLECLLGGLPPGRFRVEVDLDGVSVLPTIPGGGDGEVLVPLPVRPGPYFGELRLIHLSEGPRNAWTAGFVVEDSQAPTFELDAPGNEGIVVVDAPAGGRVRLERNAGVVAVRPAGRDSDESAWLAGPTRPSGVPAADELRERVRRTEGLGPHPEAFTELDLVWDARLLHRELVPGVELLGAATSRSLLLVQESDDQHRLALLHGGSSVVFGRGIYPSAGKPVHSDAPVRVALTEERLAALTEPRRHPSRGLSRSLVEVRFDGDLRLRVVPGATSEVRDAAGRRGADWHRLGDGELHFDLLAMNGASKDGPTWSHRRVGDVERPAVVFDEPLPFPLDRRAKLHQVVAPRGLQLPDLTGHPEDNALLQRGPNGWWLQPDGSGLQRNGHPLAEVGKAYPVTDGDTLLLPSGSLTVHELRTSGGHWRLAEVNKQRHPKLRPFLRHLE